MNNMTVKQPARIYGKMNKVAALICQATGNDSMSVWRLELLCYLVDWYSAVSLGVSACGGSWFCESSGPKNPRFDGVLRNKHFYVHEAIQNPNVVPTSTVKRLYVSLNEDGEEIQAREGIEDVVKAVAKSTRKLRFDALMDLVYSTYPYVASTRYHKLDLVDLAAEWRKVQEQNKTA